MPNDEGSRPLVTSDGPVVFVIAERWAGNASSNCCFTLWTDLAKFVLRAHSAITLGDVVHLRKNWYAFSARWFKISLVPWYRMCERNPPGQASSTSSCSFGAGSLQNCAYCTSVKIAEISASVCPDADIAALKRLEVKVAQ